MQKTLGDTYSGKVNIKKYFLIELGKVKKMGQEGSQLTHYTLLLKIYQKKYIVNMYILSLIFKTTLYFNSLFLLFL